MMVLSLGCKRGRRIHAVNWARRMADGGESCVAVALVNVKRSAAMMDWWCLQTTHLRKMVWRRFKSQWRHAMGSRRERVRFGYDPESYSQNFDDGFHGDHNLSPAAAPVSLA